LKKYEGETGKTVSSFFFFYYNAGQQILQQWAFLGPLFCVLGMNCAILFRALHNAEKVLLHQRAAA